MVAVASFSQDTKIQEGYQDAAAANFLRGTFNISLSNKSEFFWILPLGPAAGSL